jgi:hypothetical protein
MKSGEEFLCQPANQIVKDAIENQHDDLHAPNTKPLPRQKTFQIPCSRTALIFDAL